MSRLAFRFLLIGVPLLFALAATAVNAPPDTAPAGQAKPVELNQPPSDDPASYLPEPRIADLDSRTHITKPDEVKAPPVTPPGPRDDGADDCPAADLGTLSGNGSTTSAAGTCTAANHFENDGVACDYYGTDGLDVIYEFQVDASGVWTFDLCDEVWDTSLMLREETGGGCPGDWLTCNGDSCDYQSLVSATLSPGTAYYVIVDGYNSGSCGTFTLNWTAPAVAPPNDDCGTVTPVALSAGTPLKLTGDNSGATSDCSLLGDPEVWHAFTTTETLNVVIDYCDTGAAWGNFYGVLISGCPCAAEVFYSAYDWTTCANGNLTLYFDNLPAGTYYVPVLWDPAYGAVGPYDINVVATTPPACTPDFIVTAPFASPSAPLRTTCGAGDDCNVTGLDSEDHIYEVIIPEDGDWVFSLCDSAYDTKLAVGSACCTEDLGYNDDDYVNCATGTRSYLELALTAGTYFVTVDGYDGACGDYLLDIWMIPPCIVPCPPDGQPEGETCGDDVNGGCNMDPGPPVFEDIECGKTKCGTVWADAGTRDTDWYEVVLTEDMMLTWIAKAEFPVVIGLVPSSPCGSGNCDDIGTSLDPFALGGECDLISVTTDCLPPGTYWLFVSHQDYYDWPCDDFNDYTVTLTCTPCTLPRGACCLGDGNCQVLTECQCTGVYVGDGTTCDPNLCPANDQCTAAEGINEVVDLVFDTSYAMYDGTGTCTTAPNVWYCYTPTCTGPATISLCGSSYDTKLAVYQGCNCDPLGPELACEDDNCGTQSEVTIPVFPGQQYLIEIGGYASYTGPGELDVTCTPGTGTLVVEADDCQDDVAPGEAGYQVAVELWMRNLTHNATGFQAFLSFDDAVLSYRGDLSGYTADPFAEHVLPIDAAQVGTGQLDLDGSVDAAHPTGTPDDSLLATLVFDVDVECDATTVDFRTFEIFVSELSYKGYTLDTSTVAETFSSDDTPPVIDVCPAVTVVECDGAGNTAALNAWLASFAASDNCGTVTLTDDFTALSDDCGATGSATVTFTATDPCGNETSCTSTFTIEDTTVPSVDTPADDLTVECDGFGNTAELNAWLAANGGAAASDDCGGVSWSHDFSALSDDCCVTGSATVTFTATDDCGLTSTTTATFTIEDTTSPVVSGCPANIMVPADAGGCSAVVSWTPPTATDVCCDDMSEVSVASTHDPGDVFGPGLTTVTYTFEDDCGNTEVCEFTVTVQEVNEVVANVILENITLGSGGTPSSVERCVKFVAKNGTDCADAVHVKVLFDTNDPINGFAMGTAVFQVECGDWTEMCAKDEQHTLYDTQSLAIVGTYYEPTDDFVLLSGDTDNDSDVDIHDLTWLMYQWRNGGAPAAGGCPWDGTRDADFNLSGFAGGTDDYLLLSSNWHLWVECPCTALNGLGGLSSLTPAVSISVRLLRPEVARLVDTNADGFVDHEDVRAFEDELGLPNDLSRKLRRAEMKSVPSISLQPGARQR